MRKLMTLVVSAWLVAACTSGASPSAAPSTAPSEAAASIAPASESPAASPEASESAAASPAAEATVMVATSSLGDILVDAEGRTLYAFTNDTGGVPSCYEDCAQNWHALLAEGEIAVGEGLDAAAFATVDRTDGGKQVKIGDRPLYYFANDAAPGDTNGQGRGDVWYVVSPTGELIK